MDWSDLEAAARAALPHAYAPYSGFPVAAAIRFADGGIESGVNVENASYPLSVCAERNAVAAGVRSGRGRIQAVLILTGADAPTPPCGGCRQVLAEFGGRGGPGALGDPPGPDRRAHPRYAAPRCVPAGRRGVTQCPRTWGVW